MIIEVTYLQQQYRNQKHFSTSQQADASQADVIMPSEAKNAS
jgi:hypothetical protein